MPVFQLMPELVGGKQHFDRLSDQSEFNSLYKVLILQIEDCIRCSLVGGAGLSCLC